MLIHAWADEIRRAEKAGIPQTTRALHMAATIEQCSDAAFDAWDAGRPHDAVWHARRAVHLEPCSAEARYLLGLTLQLVDDLRGLFHEMDATERRLNRDGCRWRGGQMNGETVLVHVRDDDWGYGDVFQYARFVPLIAQRGARVAFRCLPGMERIFETLLGTSDVFSGNRWPARCHSAEIRTLAHIFGADIDSLPPAPYLRGDPEPWSEFLARLPGLKVGICWAGKHGDTPGYNRLDDRRSMHLSDVAPLLRTPGCSFVSLQLGPPAAQLTGSYRKRVRDVSSRLRDWADTAGLIMGLDLVISVDSAVCHLAGALGKPVWMINRFHTCARWNVLRSDTAWYGTMRIFRQTSPGDWRDVVADVAGELRRLAQDFRHLT